MSGSLKGYIPALAIHLGKSAAALYERQRALVRAGLLSLEEGRGPGSGVRTTAQSVALLIIAVLATDNLSDTGERTHAIAQAKTASGKQPVAGMKTLVDTIAAMLVQRAASRNLAELTISRTAPHATIVFRSGVTTEFGKRAETAPIQVSASITRDTFLKIADDVNAILTEGADL